MLYSSRLMLLLALLLLNHDSLWSQQPIGALIASHDRDDQILIHRKGAASPILTQAVRTDFRPYIHPIVAPDGKGVLTELSPDHHKHQTGLYWGFTRVNGRDYFHHPEGTYWKRVSARILKAEASNAQEGVQWQTVYDLLDEAGQGVLRESQIWTLRDEGERYILELEWSGEGLVDVTIGKYDYGVFSCGCHGRKGSKEK